MFNVLKKAGLSADEFSYLVDVNRTSVFNWKAGRSKPHPQVARRVEKAVEFLEKLVKLDKLPLKDGLTRDERKAKIQKIKDLFQQYT